MRPSRRSQLAWCLSSILLLQHTACSGRPKHEAPDADLQPDAEAASYTDASVDEPDGAEPTEADDDADQAPAPQDDAQRPQQPSDGPDADVANDASSANDASPTVAETGSSEANLADSASPAESGPSLEDTGAAPPTACQATKVAAVPAFAAKVDFVWVVDSSSSMFDEQAKLRDALTAFAQRAAESDLDARVIMVAHTPQLAPGPPIPGLCAEVPADPLAGHPFASDPRYHFVETYVDSGAALDVAILEYARYSAFLRSGAAVHLVVVTDDDAQYAGGAAQFLSDMQGRLGHSFHLHTFSSPGPTPCVASHCEADPAQDTICAVLAADCRASSVGTTYYELASLTTGVAASICDSDWTPGLLAIFEQVVQATPEACTYTVPAPPRGTFDPQKLNLGFAARGSDPEQVLTRVGDTDACGDNESWLYVNAAAPSVVSLCPKACARAAAGDALWFGFGCNTVVRN